MKISYIAPLILASGVSASNYRSLVDEQEPQQRKLQPGGGVTCSTTSNLSQSVTGPAAAPLRGSVACVDQEAYVLRDTNTDPILQDQDAFNIYGPMEAGFTSTVPGMSCLGTTTVAAGLDTLLAEHIVLNVCTGSTIEVLDSCGGHATPYHYHERMSCLYTSDATTGHSTRVGTAADGNGIYGMYIDGGVLPTDMDVCGGRYGVTPDSNGQEVYYYPIKNYAPFTLGCYGPVSSVDECRALYDCDSNTIETVTTEYGSGQYTTDCPCYDENRSNVVGQGYPGFLDPSLIPDGATPATPTTPTSPTSPSTPTSPSAPAGPPSGGGGGGGGGSGGNGGGGGGGGKGPPGGGGDRESGTESAAYQTESSVIVAIMTILSVSLYLA